MDNTSRCKNIQFRNRQTRVTSHYHVIRLTNKMSDKKRWASWQTDTLPHPAVFASALAGEDYRHISCNAYFCLCKKYFTLKLGLQAPTTWQKGSSQPHCKGHKNIFYTKWQCPPPHTHTQNIRSQCNKFQDHSPCTSCLASVCTLLLSPASQSTTTEVPATWVSTPHHKLSMLPVLVPTAALVMAKSWISEPLGHKAHASPERPCSR